MCTVVYTSVALFSPPRKRLLDIARLGFPMAVTFAGAVSTKQVPGGYGGRARRAGEGRVEERQPDSPGRCHFYVE
jgi:hypothetical protein